jgi:hypothetical protein
MVYAVRNNERFGLVIGAGGRGFNIYYIIKYIK